MLHKAKDALFPNDPPIVKIVPFTSNQVREYLYANYLSSLYALSEILRCLEDVGYFPPDYYKSVTTAIANDELLKYLSKARIAQDHTLDASAKRPIVGWGVTFGAHRGKVLPMPAARRSPLELHDFIEERRGKTTITPVPKTHRGKAIDSATPEILAELSCLWWVELVLRIFQKNAELPPAL
jgi:hypothetical protein